MFKNSIFHLKFSVKLQKTMEHITSIILSLFSNIGDVLFVPPILGTSNVSLELVCQRYNRYRAPPLLRRPHDAGLGKSILFLMSSQSLNFSVVTSLMTSLMTTLMPTHSWNNDTVAPKLTFNPPTGFSFQHSHFL